MITQPVYLRIATEDEAPYLKNRSCAELVIGAVIEAQKVDWMQLHGFVVLPEALEMVVTPLKFTLVNLIARLQAETIPPLAVLLPQSKTIWEAHVLQLPLRTQRALDARLAMLLLAPVASGIVDMAASYPYSSANPRYANSISVYTGFGKGETTEAARITRESPAQAF